MAPKSDSSALPSTSTPLSSTMPCEMRPEERIELSPEQMTINRVHHKLRISAACTQGGRKYMEDYYSVVYQENGSRNGLEFVYAGIFDGHGGREAAAYSKEHLMDNIIAQPGFWSLTDDKAVLGAIKAGFLLTHEDMRRELPNWPTTSSGLPSTSGTTASIVFIRNNKLYTGHVGDSRIILGRAHKETNFWIADSLTEDHKPDSDREKERIERAGGSVATKSNVVRVVWNRPRIHSTLTKHTLLSPRKQVDQQACPCDAVPFLAVARSLGDLWSYIPSTGEYAVSPEPDVNVIHLDISNPSERVIILASDGLWNMITPTEAVRLAQEIEQPTGVEQIISHFLHPIVRSKGDPSQSLAQMAIDRWAFNRVRADNTSVVTILLDSISPHTPPSSPLPTHSNESVQSFVTSPPSMSSGVHTESTHDKQHESSFSNLMREITRTEYLSTSSNGLLAGSPRDCLPEPVRLCISRGKLQATIHPLSMLPKPLPLIQDSPNPEDSDQEDKNSNDSTCVSNPLEMTYELDKKNSTLYFPLDAKADSTDSATNESCPGNADESDSKVSDYLVELPTGTLTTQPQELTTSGWSYSNQNGTGVLLIRQHGMTNNVSHQVGRDASTHYCGPETIFKDLFSHIEWRHIDMHPFYDHFSGEVAMKPIEKSSSIEKSLVVTISPSLDDGYIGSQSQLSESRNVSHSDSISVLQEKNTERPLLSSITSDNRCLVLPVRKRASSFLANSSPNGFNDGPVPDIAKNGAKKRCRSPSPSPVISNSLDSFDSEIDKIREPSSKILRATSSWARSNGLQNGANLRKALSDTCSSLRATVSAVLTRTSTSSLVSRIMSSATSAIELEKTKDEILTMARDISDVTPSPVDPNDECVPSIAFLENDPATRSSNLADSSSSSAVTQSSPSVIPSTS